MDDFEPYFSGEVLYGDDFSEAEIEEWHSDEIEGYAELGAKNSGTYKYAYHAWNVRFGFSQLPRVPFDHALGFGAAYGDELEPVLPRIRQITIVDPSSAFVRDSIGGVSATYVKPQPSGQLPLPSAEFDLVTCLGVLHLIPNVSRVMPELARVLAPGGFMLLREPIVSMGDWRQPRAGLTKHQRGIPVAILRSLVASSGLRIMSESLCSFPLTPRLFKWVRNDPYNSSLITSVDSALCRAFAWNMNYHPRTPLHRLRPRSVFFALTKDA